MILEADGKFVDDLHSPLTTPELKERMMGLRHLIKTASIVCVAALVPIIGSTLPGWDGTRHADADILQGSGICITDPNNTNHCSAPPQGDDACARQTVVNRTFYCTNSQTPGVCSTKKGAVCNISQNVPCGDLYECVSKAPVKVNGANQACGGAPDVCLNAATTP